VHLRPAADQRPLRDGTHPRLPPPAPGGARGIVNVSSVNAHLPLPYWGVYSATKAALVARSDALRMELAPWRIGVSVLTLGAFDTDIRRRGLDEWKATAGPEAELYRPALETIAAIVGALDATAADPTLVAAALIAVLRSDQPRLATPWARGSRTFSPWPRSPSRSGRPRSRNSWCRLFGGQRNRCGSADRTSPIRKPCL
jgi:NAD(P)-dependent dehydrogenase (short-subunit alcohol dehydrogenase family)